MIEDYMPYEANHMYTEGDKIPQRCKLEQQTSQMNMIQ
jgi:hypothetical protein